MKSEGIKHLIVNEVVNEAERLRKEFEPEISMYDFLDDAGKSANWKRELKERHDTYPQNRRDTREKKLWPWLRQFDCRPFDSQLRAYVLTDNLDEKLLSVEIKTE